jgi:hypothetical protein
MKRNSDGGKACRSIIWGGGGSLRNVTWGGGFQ